MFTKSRKQTADLNHLIDEALAEVADLNNPDGPAAEVHRLVRLRESTENANRTILEQLNQCSADGPMGPGTLTRHNPSADADLLFAGADVATLTATAEESERAGLLRQHRACKSLLEQIQDKIQQANFRAASEEFSRVKPMVAKIVKEVLDEYERLAAVLESLQQFDRKLSQKGLDFETRGPLFNGVDAQILHGGNGRPALRWWVDDCRKRWGLDATTSERR